MKLMYNKKKKKWEVLEKNSKEGFYMDGYLKPNLDHVVKNVTKQNYDGFILITGREGFGKSTLAMQIALYCDPERFSVVNVVFTASQFLEAVEKADKYTAIVFDETMGYLSSRTGTSKFNRILIKVMSEMRSKNLFIILCIPNFFMMDWYVALHRSTGLLYVTQRGRFASYDYRAKKKLYMKGKKDHEHVVPPTFIGRFTRYFPLDEKEYESKKQEAINEWSVDVRTDLKLQKQRDDLMIDCKQKETHTSKELAEVTGLSVRQVNNIVSEKKEGSLAGNI